ncbi:BRO-N domain-containing protein [Clostridium paraputrificum]|uniref:BRO-N domain-containing protein n=1 Tax=Clostridium paraputrificum TaxID=29363 RepID=UPI000C07CE23|nr:Bro-N domain-containing protein [Clostridium paraputrificum]
MSDIQIFSNEQFGQVRVTTKDNEPWFVGKDIAEVLGYSNTAKAIRDHVDIEDKLSERIVLSGQNREVILINESGLYSLILGSKLPTAKKFKKWVTSDVLPSIRKHGMYATDELINNPDLLIAAATKIKEERQARLEAEKLRDKLIRGFIGSGQNRNMICINESGLYSLILGRLLMTTVKNQLWNGVTIRYVVNMMLNPYLPELPKRYFRK